MSAARAGALALLAALAVSALAAVPAARADFGLLPAEAGFSVLASQDGGAAAAEQAGSHPFALRTEINFAPGPPAPGEPGVPFSDGDLKDLHIDLPPGLVENPTAVAQCSLAAFHTPRLSPFEQSRSGESCPAASQVGVLTLVSSVGGAQSRTFGVFNLAPPPGFPSQLGFSPYGAPVTITPQIRESNSEYGLTLDLLNFPQEFDASTIALTIWGTPWSLAHNAQRGNCLNEAEPSFGHAKCSLGPPKAFPPKAYLTLPTSCEAPLRFTLRASSWQGESLGRLATSGERLSGCDSLPFAPAPVVRLSTDRAGSASGFDFTLEGTAAGLVNPNQLAGSQPRRALLRLPLGMSINPSVGAGLGVCTPAGYAAETLSSAPGAGCPNAAKIGTVSVQSPLFEGTVGGSLFLAQPDDSASAAAGAENPFDSLIALYLIAKSPERGVLVRLAGAVSADPSSGQLTANFEDLPQLPYSHFNVNFRDGQRSPLATPPACGIHGTAVELAPWNDPGAVHRSAPEVALDAGIGGGPCPNGQLAPFGPKATAGTLNRNAGSYTPFYLHLTRTDAEQEITSYSAQMPPGLLGKLKGVPYCPQAAIAAAAANSGFAEAANPSCPAASEIGHTQSGYGLGSVLAYGPGRLYLAGPYHGAPFSIVAINSATVGPFDLGVIIVRSAIRVDPRSAQVSVDSTGSDPIPHIIKGIPLHLRDIRIYIDRPNFSLNPTSCEHFSTDSTLRGSGLDFAAPADDSRALAPSPFQVSNCSALDFKPALKLQLQGPTKRGGYPALKATLRPRPGDANIGRVAVTLPPSEFLAQEHIKTICTRPQFAAGKCPPASVYGHARAFTPLLNRPLEGPVYLRSSENPLPDLVTALEGNGIRIEVLGKIDTHKGGLRGTFEGLPDAPVSKFVMNLYGAKRGVLVNAEDVCEAKAPALVAMVGQNNRGALSRVRLGNARCEQGGGKR